jgi:IclR family transcriptional regulator, acetate operon repressor
MRENAGPPLDSVDRALQLVEALRDGQILSVKSAADLLSVAPSTAHRLLKALQFRRFAEPTADRGYRAGPALRLAAAEQHPTQKLKAIAPPALELLHASTDECAQLMIRQGTHIRFIDGIESSRPLRVAVRIGDQIPAHCSAGGKALLAELSGTELDLLYADGLPLWPVARLTTLDALKSQLVSVRRNGYGVNQDETETGVSGVGVAIRDSAGPSPAALTLAIPTARFSRSDLPAYVDNLRRASEFASRLLAGG